MSLPLDIINLALARLGESPIQSAEEGSIPANVAKVMYDPARKAVLRDFLWNFSIRQSKLAKKDEPLVKGLGNAFALPADCIRVVTLRPQQKFVVRGGYLFAEAEAVTIDYVADVCDPQEFDDSFVEALSYKLASDLAMSIKGSSQAMAENLNVYYSLVRKAATLSENESGREYEDNPFLAARYS